MDYTGLRRLTEGDRAQSSKDCRHCERDLTKFRQKVRNFLLATWNMPGIWRLPISGGRITDAFTASQCWINRFDLVAVQEVRQDLVALKQVMRILGKDWDCIFSDVSFADGGNGERQAFVFNRSRVHFTGLAASSFCRASQRPSLCPKYRVRPSSVDFRPAGKIQPVYGPHLLRDVEERRSKAHR